MQGFGTEDPEWKSGGEIIGVVGESRKHGDGSLGLGLGQRKSGFEYFRAAGNAEVDASESEAVNSSESARLVLVAGDDHNSPRLR